MAVQRHLFSGKSVCSFHFPLVIKLKFKYPTIVTDEQQITGNLSTEIRKNEDTGLATINETLTYTFRAADNRRKIRCLTTALWLRADEHGEADLVLNVLCKSVHSIKLIHLFKFKVN